jgi:hypothetical protein
MYPKNTSYGGDDSPQPSGLYCDGEVERADSHEAAQAVPSTEPGSIKRKDGDSAQEASPFGCKAFALLLWGLKANPRASGQDSLKLRFIFDICFSQWYGPVKLKGLHEETI